MKEVLILIGFPGCGKSTFTKSLGRGYTVLSSDSIRLEICGDEEDQTKNKDVFFILKQRLRHSLQRDENVVVDATNLTPAERRYYISVAKRYGASPIGIFIDTPLSVCKSRNARRTRVVPDFVYDKMEAKFIKPSMKEGFDEIRVVSL